MKILFTILALSITQNISLGQCVEPPHIYSFTYNNHHYEVVKENRKWSDANDCAMSLGGHLCSIESKQEQDFIFNELKNNSGIVNSSTIAPDGGGAPYIWLAGNDIIIEGKWIWINEGNQFWSGDKNGNVVGGMYNNWGSINNREPDNYMDKQHALGLCLSNWPNGKAGEWNDIDESNELYYIIERENTTGLNNPLGKDAIKIFPNPVNGSINISSSDENDPITGVEIFDITGRKVSAVNDTNSIIQINVLNLKPGLFLLYLKTKSQLKLTRHVTIN